jgi:hypothetical protein
MNTDDGLGHYNADGIVRMWIDGVRVMNNTTQLIRADQFNIGRFFANFYHGGTGRPVAPFHYEFGGVCVATEYIGPPKKLLPVWRQGQALYEWREISGSGINVLGQANLATWNAPGIYGSLGYQAIPFTRNGASADTRDSTVWMLANGGHGGYYGNQAIKIKLSVDAPVWVEAAPPSDGSQVTFDTRTYLDGRPSSAHSYYGEQFIEARNRAMRFGSQATSGTGNGSFPNIVSFNPVSGLYEADGTYPDIPFVVEPSPNTMMCKDPATENVMVWNHNNFARWNQATNTWTMVFQYMGDQNVAPLNAGGFGCVDTRRNLLFTLGYFASSGSFFTMTLNTIPPTFVRVTLTGDNTALLANAAGWGVVFQAHPTDPSQDVFLMRKPDVVGGDIYRVNASTFFVDHLTTTGGDNAPAPAGTIPIYNRFLALPNLGGIAYIPGSGNIWFLRTQ